MEYREHAPGDRLAPFVDCIWTLRGEGNEPERIFPDGRPELVLNLADPFDRQKADGSIERQALALLVGQTTDPVIVQPTGYVDLVGVRFRPYGAPAFIAPPLHEITFRITALDDVDRSWTMVRERIGSAEPRARATVMRTLLEPRIARNNVDPRVAAATREIAQSQGRSTIDELAARLGLGRRQLERLFLRDVGIAPKLLARILRFQALLRAARAPSPDAWAALAAAFGFADQSHMIRDVRRFTGETPSTLLAGAAPPALFLEA